MREEESTYPWECYGRNHYKPSDLIGRTVTAASIEATTTENRLVLTLDGGDTFYIWDDGQSCCERRYTTTDDDPYTLVGHKLIRIEAKAGPNVQGEYGDEHEQVFVEVATDGGFITLVNHNEHNGWYGGFGLTITASE